MDLFNWYWFYHESLLSTQGFLCINHLYKLSIWLGLLFSSLIFLKFQGRQSIAKFSSINMSPFKSFLAFRIWLLFHSVQIPYPFLSIMSLIFKLSYLLTWFDMRCNLFVRSMNNWDDCFNGSSSSRWGYRIDGSWCLTYIIV